MHSFTDNQGRSWVVAINVASAKRVRSLTGVDLYALVNDNFQALGKLVDDAITLVDVLFCLSTDPHGRPPLDDEDFGRSLVGDAIGRATDAFLEDLVDFFPDPRRRAGLKKVIDATRRVVDGTLNLSTRRLSEVDLDAEVERLIGSSGSSPGPSASTPVPSPSASST